MNPTSNCATASSDYTANGKQYRILSTANGYKADGVAEIYSDKLQGSQTSGCEEFDLSGFTAAHRTLPLPTHIKITNKNNKQSVVVKVNDRGPAKGNSLIQVTPAVANLLGAGKTFPVYMEAITASHSGLLTTPTAASKPVPQLADSGRTLRTNKKPVNRGNADRYFIIVGTYESKEEALDKFVRVSSIGLANAAMETRNVKGKSLHMVRLGPYYEQDKIDNAKDRLKNDGLVQFKVVKN